MLCPEVLSFEADSSKTSFVVSKNVKLPSDEIFDQLKFCIPGSVHTPDTVKNVLSGDTEFYKVERNFPFDSLVDEQFLQTFVANGKLFLQTFVTSNDSDHFLCISPSGWLFIGADRYSVDGLGFESHHVRKSKDGKVILGLNLKQFSSPVTFSWFPNDPNVCPSTLAKYYVDRGVNVEEVFVEFLVTRFFPVLEQVPTFSFDDDDEFAAEDFENWVGAAFCQIQSNAIPSSSSKVSCKSVLCLNVQGLFDSKIVNGVVKVLSDHLQSKGDIPWVSFTCRHPIVAAKASKDLTSKERRFVHKTFVLFKNGKIVSAISKF